MADRVKVARGVSPFAMGLLLSLGICLTGLGGYQLYRLDDTHLRREVLYSVSPGTLQVWLATLDPADRENAARLSDRFVSMTLPQRRDAVLAIARPGYFEAMGLSFADRRRLQMLILQASGLALAKAPALGELWFLSAKLRNTLFGFDATTGHHVELSFAYSPKEVDLVLERLQMMSIAWPLLSNRLRNIVRHDVRIVDQTFPDRAAELRQYLHKAGAKL
ncbi:hypothetical protein [Anderseniella sp. Alg231-50]|uniref:hypothetical protein n=1 Tax=Anderseniella sp. Alg231-50 TaxID=1922226 RepID=UPI00307C8781